MCDNRDHHNDLSHGRHSLLVTNFLGESRSFQGPIFFFARGRFVVCDSLVRVSHQSTTLLRTNSNLDPTLGSTVHFVTRQVMSATRRDELT